MDFRWFYDVIGDSRCPISDTWWQTETGGFMVTVFIFFKENLEFYLK
jgi:acyl-coenzyme A synthetase/AMP-(fatty) acid ligase